VVVPGHAKADEPAMTTETITQNYGIHISLGLMLFLMGIVASKPLAILGIVMMLTSDNIIDAHYNRSLN
jgi:hypothetical protein